jgi:flagellar hook-basal body complex protein FliE
MMQIDKVDFLPASLMPTIENGATAAPGGDFASWFGSQLSQLNGKLQVADQGAQRLAAGEAGNLHQVMIDLEEAKLSLQLVMQVRNHLLDAYRDVAQMQL